jgi:signal transduction histidine kinase
MSVLRVMTFQLSPNLATVRRRVSSFFGPRPYLLVGKASVALALVAAFAYVTLNSQEQSRTHAQEQFDAEAAVTAKLTAALFTSAAGSGAVEAAKNYGARVPTIASLDAQVKRSNLEYLLVLDASGDVIASSSGTPAVLLNATTQTRHVRQALAGHAWLSDVQTVSGKPSMAWALPFETQYGRRVLLQGMDTVGVSKFLGETVGQGETDTPRQGYVVDGRNQLVAAAGRAIDVGQPADPKLAASSGSFSDGRHRYFTSARIDGSDWRVVLTTPTSELNPALAGWRQYFSFAVITAFGIAAALSLVFFRRVLVSGAQLEEKHNELLRLNVTLEHKVAERTAASEERARELARSNDELQQFASIASHDLQEPLRKIRMFGDRLVKRDADDLPDETRSDVQRIQSAALRMQRLIDDLLSFARVTSREREFAPTDLGKVTAEVVTDLEARIEELGAEVHVGELPVVEADKVQMRQLMQNLISNALKFHRPEERPVVRVHSRVIDEMPARFDGEQTPGARCEITVDDNGVGFDQQYAERIFSAFERLHSRADYDGTGIGLSIARKIAWRHGGDISATGTPGEGASFTVTLPLQNGHTDDGHTANGG